MNLVELHLLNLLYHHNYLLFIITFRRGVWEDLHTMGKPVSLATVEIWGFDTRLRNIPQSPEIVGVIRSRFDGAQEGVGYHSQSAQYSVCKTENKSHSLPSLQACPIPPAPAYTHVCKLGQYHLLAQNGAPDSQPPPWRAHPPPKRASHRSKAWGMDSAINWAVTPPVDARTSRKAILLIMMAADRDV
jgi:hypothetical protein